MQNGGDGSFLWILVERSPRADRLRRRLAAIAAAVLLVTGLLAILGLGLVALTVLAVSATVAAVLVMRNRGAGAALRTRIESVSRQRLGMLTSRARREPGRDDADEATAEMAVVAVARRHRTTYGRIPLPTQKQLGEALSRLLPALQRQIGHVLAGTSALFAASPSSPEAEGSRCNALGVALRRAGRAQQAATLHEAARVIFAGVGDSRGEALAANALGVALSEVGKQDAALEQFEQARTLLRELGDEQWEGKVLANIGLAKHRVGRDAEALDLLQRALAKLEPETDAYRVVERQLRRAS